MLLQLPIEVLLQVTDHLTPSDLSTLSQMAELAFLFHYITDQSLTGSNDTLFFHPHPSVQCSHLFSDRIVVDTSRYYLIEVKGAQSLVVAEDKTKHTRRVISVLNQIEHFSLDIKTIVKPEKFQKKYVLTGFPTVIMHKLQIDPKILEIYNSSNVSMIDTVSLDDTFHMKISNVNNLLISNCHENVFANIDFSTTPLNDITVDFPNHKPLDLHIGEAKNATLFDFNHLQKCQLSKVDLLLLRPVEYSHIDTINAPNLTILKIVCDTVAPRVDEFNAPLLDTLLVYEQSMLNHQQERAILLADENDIKTDTLFNNRKLWSGLSNLLLSISSTRMLTYTHHATQLVELNLNIHFILDPTYTRTLKFPLLERLMIVLGVSARDHLPEFQIDSLTELSIKGDTRIMSYHGDPHGSNLEESFPKLNKLTLDHFDMVTITSVLGHSRFPQLHSLNLLRVEVIGPYIKLNAQFPNLVETQLILSLQSPKPIHYMLHTPMLQKMVYKAEGTAMVEHIPNPALEGQNANPWDPDGNHPPSSIFTLNDYPHLERLIISGVSELYLTKAPQISEIVHGGMVDLDTLECDGSVRHLQLLCYRNRSVVKPIQSIVGVFPNLDRRVIHSAIHPRKDEFSY